MNQESNTSNWKKTLLISLLILAGAVIVTYLIFQTEPTAEKVSATKETAMLVDVTPAEKGNFTPTIIATGTVQAAQDIMLNPRVSGQIVRISNEFVPGGFVRKGQMLVQIDPADFQNQVQLRQSELEQAQADLKIELGRQEVARKDFQLLQDELKGVDSSLVLRQPQLESVRSRIKAAQAALEQANLNMDRSSVRAPFNAHIINRNANVGSQVAPGDMLGRIVGTDEYWVMVSIPLSKSNWLSLPDDKNSQGAPVRIKNRTAWPQGVYRQGHLYKKIGALEQPTRLQQFLVKVPDPLAVKLDSPELPPLVVGAFVETEIQAKEIRDVVRLDRDYLRQDETAWVMKDGALQIRELDIVFKDARYAYIRDGIGEGEQVVTTNLSTVVEGSPLRTTEKDTSQPSGMPADTSKDNGS